MGKIVLAYPSLRQVTKIQKKMAIKRIPDYCNLSMHYGVKIFIGWPVQSYHIIDGFFYIFIALLERIRFSNE